MNAPIRVVHFISSGAHNWFVYPPLTHADRARFDVSIGTLSPPGELHAAMKRRGIHSFTLGCTSRRQYPGAVLRLAWWLRRERIEVFQTHLYDAAMVGLLAARLAGVPLVIATNHHSHEVILQRRLRGRRLTLLIDTVCNRLLAHYNIVPSAIIRDILTSDEGVPPRKIALIPYGFDCDRLQAGPDARARVREELGLAATDLVIGSVGRLYWVKNHAALLRAFALLAREIPNLMLVIVGAGPERESLPQKAASLGIADRVIFTGFREDIPDMLAAMDIYVHPSLAEAFCVATAEAVALGKPLVSTAVGGVREMVEDGVNGYIVPPGNVRALHGAILKLLLHSGQWPEMGLAGQRRVAEYSAARMARAYEAQYVRWLGQRKHRQRG